MAKKVILKDDNVEIMPITRGELILDSSGQLAFHSSQFLATQSLPGLMSGEDKTKLDSLEKVIVEDKKVEQVNTTANDNYRLLFSSSADDTTKTEGAQKSAKLLFNPSTGALTATALIGKLDWSNLNGIPEKFTPEQHIHNTSEITALTSYSKSNSASDLVITDTLNAALGKLEYKADTAYDWIISVTTADTDKYINKWQEILDFLNAVDNSEGADIIDEFVTRKTGQTITGVKTFSTLLKFIVALGTSPFTVTSTTKVDNLNADLLDGKHDGEVTAQYFSPGKLLTSSDTINKLMSGIYCYINGDNPTGSVDDNVVLLSFRNTGRTDMIQFAGAANTSNLYYRRAANIGNQYENWTSWKTIAFTDSNVASATQVMINYSYNQDINYPLVFTSRDNIGVAKNGDLYIDFSGRPTYNPKSNTLTVGNINMTGSINNVLKATTSLGAALLNIAEVTADTNYVHLYVSSLNSSATNNRALVLQNGYGNVGIGDSNPAYKLEVAGSICGTVIYANRDASTTAGGVSLYSNSDPMTYGIAFRGTGTYGTHGYVTAADDWATYLTMSDTANRGWIFRRGSTNVASIAGSGNMAIGQNLKFSNEAHISTNRSTDYHYGYTFNLTANEQSIGMYSGPIGEAGGVVVSPDGCLIYNSSDCGYNLQVRDKDLGSDLTNIATLTFGIEQSGYYAWSRGGFKKNGSDDTYVLLGGGGHKLESNLVVSSASTANRATTANMISHSTYYYNGNVMKNSTSAGTIFGESATANYLFPSFMEAHPTWGNYADVINFTGYCMWGGTQLATEYNAINPRVAIRKFNQSRSNWGDWTEFITTANIGSQSVNYANSAGNASYYTLGPSATYTNVWDCNTPDRIVYSDYGSSGRSVANAPSGWTYGTLLELGHMNYRGQHNPLNLQLMWDVAHGTTNGGTLWFRGNCSTYGWAKNWCKVLSDQNYSSYALPLSGGWMNKDATIYFKNPAGGTSPYAGIGYRTSVNGTMHCTSAANASGAFYIFSNGYDSANDFGGIAIDNEGVTVFGAGDPGNNFTGVFRVLNEDNPGDGPLFIVTKASGATVKYNMYAAHFYESSDQRLKENIQAILNKDNIPQIKEFNWKESGEHSYGLIAQELEEQGYSELVSTKDDGYKTVNYSAALSLIVGKLQVKIKELEKEIENLKNKN